MAPEVTRRSGWEKHGLPSGKRSFREPMKVPEYNALNAVYVFPFFIIAVLYGLFLNIKSHLAKYFWAEPISLEGKVCFVTGSGRGLGRQICLDLAKRGAKIACADINEETNKITLKELEDMGATAKAYKLNVANRNEVLKIAKIVEEDLGPVYLVVNNAAILLFPSELTEDVIRATFNVNTLGPMWVTQAFLPKMEERNSGNIVNICSVASFHPVPRLDIYSATKAALRSYSQSVSMRLKSKGSDVKITMICPTLMNSNEDQCEVLMKSGNKPVSMKTVSRALIHAVTYGFEDLTVPRVAKDIIFFQWLPKKAVNLFFRLTNFGVFRPTIKEYEKLPTGQIVRDCSENGENKA